MTDKSPISKTDRIINVTQLINRGRWKVNDEHSKAAFL